MRRQLIAGIAVSRHGCSLKEVAAAVIPAVLVLLAQLVVVVGGGIERRDKGGAVNGQQRLVALSKEIAALVTVGVTRALSCRGTAPPHRSRGMKQAPASHCAGGYLGQVISSCQIVVAEHFGLQRPTIAIHVHAVETAEACTTHQPFRQLVDARRRHTNLHPPARRKDRVGGV